MVAAARATGERDGGTAETDESEAETPTQEAPGGCLTHWNRTDDPRASPRQFESLKSALADRQAGVHDLGGSPKSGRN